MTPERREEVRRLLAATARHLAAKERGEDSNLGYAKVRPLDTSGNVIGEWKELGPITINMTFKEIDPEALALLIGKDVQE